MKEDLIKSIIEDLEKSGFASQMHAIQKCIDRGWNVSGSNSYYDRDEAKTREFDFHTHSSKSYKLPNKKNCNCYFHIVAEVKKSEKPWVLFKDYYEKNHPLKGLDAWNNLICYEGLPKNKDIITKKLSTYSIANILRWRATGIHESFKNPDSPSRWYSSCVSACKAAEHVLEGESWEVDEDKKNAADLENNPPEFLFVKPIIVLDGLLSSAELTDTNKILVEEIKYATMDFEFRSRNYSRRHYSLDFVTLESMDEYLMLSEKRHHDIFKAILKSVGIKSDS